MSNAHTPMNCKALAFFKEIFSNISSKQYKEITDYGYAKVEICALKYPYKYRILKNISLYLEMFRVCNILSYTFWEFQKIWFAEHLMI